MVVGNASREGTAFDRLPEIVFQLAFFVIAGDNTPLRTEERLVRGAGDDLRALFKRFLEVVADNAKHMRHVIHDGRLQPDRVDEFPDLCDRLLMDHHALAEDDKLRLVLFDHLFRLFDIDLEQIVRMNREIDDRTLFRHRIDRDVVVQRAHRLCGQVSAADDVVV